MITKTAALGLVGIDFAPRDIAYIVDQTIEQARMAS